MTPFLQKIIQNNCYLFPVILNTFCHKRKNLIIIKKIIAKEKKKVLGYLYQFLFYFSGSLAENKKGMERAELCNEMICWEELCKQ